jgi:hypothetical protein
MLLVAFSRWRVERCFEDQKSEIGLDQYEGRRYQGLKRHVILSCISYLFLTRMRQDFGGEKPGADGVPSAHSDRGADPVLVVEHFAPEEAAGANLPGNRANAEEERLGEEVPHQADAAQVTRPRHQTRQDTPMLLGLDLAL